MNKTYKREVASALLTCLMALAAYATMSDGALRVLEILTPPVFLFAGASFGLDAWAKQIKGA